MIHNIWYGLDDNNNHYPILNTEEGARWFESSNKRRVLSTNIGDVHISTVFLAIDHNFGVVGPPVLFETMIFGGQFSDWQQRYCTWDESVRGHWYAVALARNSECR